MQSQRRWSRCTHDLPCPSDRKRVPMTPQFSDEGTAAVQNTYYPLTGTHQDRHKQTGRANNRLRPGLSSNLDPSSQPLEQTPPSTGSASGSCSTRMRPGPLGKHWKRPESSSAYCTFDFPPDRQGPTDKCRNERKCSPKICLVLFRSMLTLCRFFNYCPLLIVAWSPPKHPRVSVQLLPRTYAHGSA